MPRRRGRQDTPPHADAQEKSAQFGIVLASVMRREDVSPEARYLYALLTTWAYGDGVIEHGPSRVTLAQISGRDERTVSRWLAELESKGLLQRDLSRGRATTYRLLPASTGDTSVSPGETSMSRGAGVTTDIYVPPQETSMSPLDTSVPPALDIYVTPFKKGIQERERERGAREPEPVSQPAAAVLDRNGPAPPMPSTWPPGCEPIFEAFWRWSGTVGSVAMVQIVRGLLMPAGSGTGARYTLSGGAWSKRYEGFTVQQVLDSIEALYTAGHWSPRSLIRHIAGEMTFDHEGSNGATNGTKQRSQSPRRDGAESFEDRRRRHEAGLREGFGGPIDPSAGHGDGRALPESGSG